ncbi:hypothetical protein JOE25_002434 [Serratia sp. PL17]|nr:hypothetical protein [Serratia sp. PL17]
MPFDNENCLLIGAALATQIGDWVALGSPGVTNAKKRNLDMLRFSILTFDIIAHEYKYFFTLNIV